MANFPPPPAFMADGTFQWSRCGYFYSGPHTEDLGSPKALSSSDPWMALAARLEQAKVGTFDALRDLLSRASRPVSRLYAGGCAALFGDAAPERDVLGQVSSRLASAPPEELFGVCWAATCSGLPR